MIFGAILAGGVGRRIERHTIPKQFIEIGGTPIIVITIREFLKNKRFDKIYVAINNDWIVYAENLFEESFSRDELEHIKIVLGGKERIDSFINIMNDIVNVRGIREEDILICHDSVRPFVRQQMINDCIDETLKHKLALTVIPVSDTIHISEDKEFINDACDRERLYNGQNPSGFQLKCLYEACKKFKDEDKSKVTGTTQLMLKLGYKIKIVKGHTSNFKITTDNDLDVAERLVRENKNNKIELLDCTLRDGGIAIDFDFSQEKITDIKQCLEKSGIEYIECGYINAKSDNVPGKTKYISDKAINDTFFEDGKRENVKYVAMIDYGTFDVRNLEERNEFGIDGIRLAFHKENWRQALEEAKMVLDKGYELFVQPMVAMRYSDEEFIELIKVCDEQLPQSSAFYIVDSFGQMDAVSLKKKVELVDRYLSKNMKIGFHAHNNRQLAFANATEIVNYPMKHNLILDSCIMGMGKGAGNLCTELIIPTLISKGNTYSTDRIYDNINKYFSKVYRKHPWGYCLEYYIASLYGCTPSYIKIFMANERITTDRLIKLLENIPVDKRHACDKAFAKEYLEQYIDKL